ncbi:HAMP domain-containing histidine kinase [Pseudoalteromonas sp. GCY]|nr:HAMP domain-containing histidine kinase [Pseudoalteromonas sp. GCY]QQQ64630.1 HAMP domain-containing histidine kinase [Pseudoalteromonas sp. GCY]
MLSLKQHLPFTLYIHEYTAYFEIVIVDNGIGVEADIRNKIFELFYT